MQVTHAARSLPPAVCMRSSGYSRTCWSLRGSRSAVCGRASCCRCCSRSPTAHAWRACIPACRAVDRQTMLIPQPMPSRLALIAWARGRPGGASAGERARGAHLPAADRVRPAVPVTGCAACSSMSSKPASRAHSASLQAPCACRLHSLQTHQNKLNTCTESARRGRSAA